MNTKEYKAQLIGDDKSFSIILYDGEKDEGSGPKRYATFTFFSDGMLIINKEGPEVVDGVYSVPFEGIKNFFHILPSLITHIQGESKAQPTETKET